MLGGLWLVALAAADAGASAKKADEPPIDDLSPLIEMLLVSWWLLKLSSVCTLLFR